MLCIAHPRNIPQAHAVSGCSWPIDLALYVPAHGKCCTFVISQLCIQEQLFPYLVLTRQLPVPAQRGVCHHLVTLYATN